MLEPNIGLPLRAGKPVRQGLIDPLPERTMIRLETRDYDLILAVA